MISMTSLWPSAKRGTHTAAIAIGSGRWLVCITCYPRFLPDYLLYLMHTSLSIYPMFPQFMYISIYIYIMLEANLQNQGAKLALSGCSEE